MRKGTVDIVPFQLSQVLRASSSSCRAVHIHTFISVRHFEDVQGEVFTPNGNMTISTFR